MCDTLATPISQCFLATSTHYGKISIWNGSHAAVLQSWQAHHQRINSVCFSPDGSLLASGSDDQMVRLWDAESGAMLRELSTGRNAVLSVIFCPDGRLLACASVHIRIYDANSFEKVTTMRGHSKRVNCVSFHPDGLQLASASDDMTVKIWSVSGGHLLHSIAGFESGFRSVSYSPNGLQLACGADHYIKMWNATALGSPSSTEQLVHHICLSFGGVFSLSYSSDGTRLAAASFDRTVTVLDTSTGAVMNRLIGHDRYVSSVVFGPGDEVLASGCIDGSIKLWDGHTGALITTFGDSWVTCVCFRPDPVRLW